MELMNYICSTDKKYDAVVFFEAFHHFFDHYAILEKLKMMGRERPCRMFLFAEPIMKKFHYPWGLRFDLGSLRAMRKWGWVELGFTVDYIKMLADALSLHVEHIQGHNHLMNAYVLHG